MQYSGDSFCGKTCTAASECAGSEDCVSASDFSGLQVKVCLPRTGSCTAGAGCGTCPQGTTCTLELGACQTIPDAGSSATPDGGSCGTRVPPDTASCCKSCNPTSSTCQANGCYGGWWCDTANAASCSCKAPPTTCGGASGSGGTGGGSGGGGGSSAGGGGTPPPGDGGLIGPSGGTVDRLYFAVVGDTRPANPDATSSYPTAIINKIYADIAALNPPPQFVLTTGDYQFSSATGTQAAIQLGYYKTARNQYPGTVFATMGNHECNGATAGNCVGNFSGRNNYDAYWAALVTPIGQSLPYYSIPIQTSAGLAKFIFTACNAWDATQKSWLAGELGSTAPLKFILRHESMTATAPCSGDMNPMVQAASYDLMIVGHTHLFEHSGKELVVGMGGAPISGNTPYGFITVEQLAAGGWQVNQYDSTTAMIISTFVVP